MSTATLLIPCPLCDTLPFSEPAELADHLTTSCAARTAPAATPAPAPVAPAPEPIRSFSPGGTRATVTPTTVRPNNACSEAQISFIGLLCDRTGADRPDFTTLTKRDASKLIDTLKARPAASKATPAAAPSHDGITLEHGRVYATADGTFVKVTESKSGNLYGKLLDSDGKFTDYQKGLLPRITRHLTAEEAARFGHEHHRCVFCARNLSDEKDGRSVEVGYGPVCADKYGLPWG